MTMNQNNTPQMDANTLYREETFTDQQVGTIRRMTPVTAMGEDDAGREVIYVGQAQMMTPAGALPLSFIIEASDLAEACSKFAEGATQAMEDAIKELQEMRRQQASSIVIPGQEKGGFSGIQMP